MDKDLLRARIRASLPASARRRRAPRIDPSAVSSWQTEHGCVVSFGGIRVYYGRCRDCSALVTTRRGHGEGGRWPSICDACRDAKSDRHAEGARRRMARLRESRYAFRDEQYAKRGWPAVRQGVSAGLTDPDDNLDDWYDRD